ncbi:BglG family transcription antiterminator [Fervidibacillus halotolerans]|uniref:Ascorbate-specific PTS system EIIA component n=1 Tax=Fervidibacillus halotolerans TaxID=2980027 RepID=A0A9E8LYU4_9BACI|nr:BglG family transcription antiterminator [Fervidibacillus halotolerans]WAA12081.1 BglG family transcription antiterminator [Fervidibacillus halotolerans]
MLDRNSLELFHYLATVRPISIEVVLKTKKISSRQFFYSLDKINYWLKLRHLPEITIDQNQLSIPSEMIDFWNQNKDVLFHKTYVFNGEERALLLLIYTFIRTDLLSHAHYQSLLNVSKNTITSDIKKANEISKDFRVQIHYSREKGFHLKGQEDDKRNLILKCISLFSSHPRRGEILSFVFFAHNLEDQYAKYEKKMIQLATQYHLTFIEGRMFEFIYLLQMVHIRQKEKKYIQIYSGTMEFLGKHNMYEAAKAIQKQLEGSLLPEELTYLTMLLLGITVGNVPAHSSTILTEVTKKMIQDFERYTCIQIEDKQKAFESLFGHFQPAYYRMLYKIPITNPLLKEIKEEHHTIFQIVSEVMRPIGEMLNIEIPDEEIGFLSLHFGALLEKESVIDEQGYRAMIVCPNGISSSLMVETYLKNLFPMFTWVTSISKDTFLKMDPNEYDMIFSTIPLDTTKPLFIVKPIMNEVEKKHLQHAVFQYLSTKPTSYPTPEQIIKIVEKHASIKDKKGLTEAISKLLYGQPETTHIRGNQPMLNELLTEDMIQFQQNVSDWKEAIAITAKPLLEKGAITQSYIDKMIENVEEIGPYIVIHPGIAIPHARPEFGVEKLGMSFLKLTEPTNILNEEKNQVQILICLAAIDNNSHLKALSQLTKLLGNKESLNQLFAATSKEEVLELIQSYSDQ